MGWREGVPMGRVTEEEPSSGNYVGSKPPSWSLTAPMRATAGLSDLHLLNCKRTSRELHQPGW